MRPQDKPAAGRAATARDGIGRAGPVAPVELALANGPRAPASARTAITAAMAAHLSEAVLADALLVVAELVTNSVRHAHADADAPITVRAELHPAVVRLEVADSGNGGSVARRAPDLERGGGFGLNLVATLSEDWGVEHTGGTRVWAELARTTQHTDGPPANDGGTASEPTGHNGARSDTAALLRARAQAAVRHAAAACDAAARAQDNARRAHARRAQLRAQRHRSGGASPFDNAPWPPSASPILAAPE
jgi:anti-sigma regulatory factor (Ser/Thr protein kinase)